MDPAYSQGRLVCGGDNSAPPAVADAMDRVLLSLVDEKSSGGYAPGAVLWVEAPDWRYARARGTRRRE